MFIVQLYASQNAGDFFRFCCCWSSAGDKFEMLESPAECGRLGNYSSVSNRREEAIAGGCSYLPVFNRRGCSCRLVFNKKRVLIEGGMHVGSFSMEKEC